MIEKQELPVPEHHSVATPVSFLSATRLPWQFFMRNRILEVFGYPHRVDWE